MTLQADIAYQTNILPHVSRTFALTIPQLPPPLQLPVANAYLLCRIVDTIEDSPLLTPEQKKSLCHAFNEAVHQPEVANSFASKCSEALANHEHKHELDLINHTEQVLRITHSFDTIQKNALLQCIEIMSQGMADFAQKNTQYGLSDLRELDHYCYYVAGVVGEMLSVLFRDFYPDNPIPIKEFRKLAVSFGQGLQMTNILKDIWDDKDRDACWLPNSIFTNHGFSLKDIEKRHGNQAFIDGMEDLIAIAHGHLQNALTYTLSFPKSAVGIRRFCLWAIGMALLTLRKINNNRYFTESSDVKISRRAVKLTILLTNSANCSNFALKGLFAMVAKPLPPAPTPLAINRPDVPQFT